MTLAKDTRDTATGDLAAGLRDAVGGEVRFTQGDRALYATGGSNYKQMPIGVVIPRVIDDVISGMEVCRNHDVPVLGRGGGTSLAGQACNVAVVFDFSKYLHHVLEIDPERRVARVQPGCILDDLRGAAEQHGLTFGPDPATHSHCTLGGMVGNNSCGVHSVMAGKTVDNVVELDVLTYDGLRMIAGATDDERYDAIVDRGGPEGRIYRGLRDLRDRYADQVRARYPQIPRRVSGYNLDELLPERGFHLARALVGSEGTCAMVLEATVRLVPNPPHRELLVLGFDDIYAAADRIPDLLDSGCIGLEGLDQLLADDVQRKGLHAENLRLLPDGHGWLLLEFGGETPAEAHDRATRTVRAVERWTNAPSVALYEDERDKGAIWKIRESGLGATARVPGQPDTWEGWEDSAVPPERLGEYLRRLRELYDRHGYQGSFYGHFGQGCVHTRIDFDLMTTHGIRTFRRFMEDATDLVVELGGSLSGEHGDGQSRAEFLPKMFGKELVDAFREFKAVWDPEARMNPGKVVDPHRIDDDLRLGPDFNPMKVRTHFQYPDDDQDLARATLRCVGVGECRRVEGGTMCPSYMVTREEKHSTRGRAHLLFELLTGEVGKGWRSDAVNDALDLCLSCKGCKSDCPVNVDMATYKAEFLSHHYRGRLRPAAAYSMGQIMHAARVGRHVPRLANFVTHAPVVSRVAKRLAGVSSEREVPAFARQSFRDWFSDRPIRNEDAPPVLLWPDTFNDAFHPEILQAGTHVLEAVGFRVHLPDRWLCCGRPLYDFGFLGQAKRRLRQIIRTMRDGIRAGIPVVGLEPSCAAVFRDELVNLFPRDQDARRLSEQTYVLSEFLAEHAPDVELPRTDRPAVVHGHCHHKAVMGFDAEERLLDRLGIRHETLDSGCCGMAGAFGFERDHYDISIAIGERKLLPAVRDADAETLLIADGFSCREQIRQTTGRQAHHVAEVIAAGLSHEREEIA